MEERVSKKVMERIRQVMSGRKENKQCIDNLPSPIPWISTFMNSFNPTPLEVGVIIFVQYMRRLILGQIS